MKKKNDEADKRMKEKVIRTLSGEKLSAIKAMLEKDHSIDCIFLLMLSKGQWKHAKEFMRKSGLTLPDGTFRARMKEIEYNGLAIHEKIDPKKKRWIITEFGEQVGKLLLEFFGQIDNGGIL